MCPALPPLPNSSAQSPSIEIWCPFSRSSPLCVYMPVRTERVRVDLAVAEVADEQIAAEAAEVGRRLCEPPGRVQLAVLGHTRDEVPGRVELVHEAASLAGDLVLGVRILLGERDEDVPADRLDPERRIAARAGPCR